MDDQLVVNPDFIKIDGISVAEQLPHRYDYQRAILREISLYELFVLNLAINWSEGSHKPIHKKVDDFRYFLGLQDQCSDVTMRKYLHSLANKGFIELKKSKLNYNIVVNHNKISQTVIDNLAQADENLKLYQINHKELIQKSVETNRNNMNFAPDMNVLNSFDYTDVSLSKLAQFLHSLEMDKDIAGYFATILYYYNEVAGEPLQMTEGSWFKMKQAQDEVFNQVNPVATIRTKVYTAYADMMADKKRGITQRYFAQYYVEADKD